MKIKTFPLKNPVITEIEIPGSKSFTNRALLLSALCKSEVTISNPLFSDDTKAMINCLKTLGIEISVEKNSIKVLNDIASIKNKEYELDASLSGTTIRFITALSTIVRGTKIIHGKEGLNKRPIKDLVDGLRQLGAKIEYLDKEGYPPIKISSSKLNQGTVKISGSTSSQFVSALLMIAPVVGNLTIEIIDEQTSKPYIEMTLDIMKKFGVSVLKRGNKYIVPNHRYSIKKYTVEGDVSSASYFFAIAALTKLTLTLKNLNPNSVQADMKFLKILEKLGNKISFQKDSITFAGKGISTVNVDMKDCPDQIQTMAVLASFAKGTSKISGIKSLRVKETERVKALEKELGKMGIKTVSTADSIIIEGGSPKPAIIDTYGDHRMAMAFAVAGAKLAGMEIKNPKVVEKSFPDFWEKLESIGVGTKILNQVQNDKEGKNIVLIGMRGSGKTTIAKLLSKKLNREFLELDEVLAEKEGKNIREIVSKKGWDYFRNKESEIVKEVLSINNKIISTGGGVVVKNSNVESLKKNGILIYLKASPNTLLKRIGEDKNRPSLTDKKTQEEEIEEVLSKREKLYKNASDEIIVTDDLSEEETAKEIIKKDSFYRSE